MVFVMLPLLMMFIEVKKLNKMQQKLVLNSLVLLKKKLNNMFKNM